MSTLWGTGGQRTTGRHGQGGYTPAPDHTLFLFVVRALNGPERELDYALSPNKGDMITRIQVMYHKGAKRRQLVQDIVLTPQHGLVTGINFTLTMGCPVVGRDIGICPDIWAIIMPDGAVGQIVSRGPAGRQASYWVCPVEQKDLVFNPMLLDEWQALRPS